MSNVGVDHSNVSVSITITGFVTTRFVAVLTKTTGSPSPGHYLAGVVVSPLTVMATGSRDLLTRSFRVHRRDLTERCLWHIHGAGLPRRTGGRDAVAEQGDRHDRDRQPPEPPDRDPHSDANSDPFAHVTPSLPARSREVPCAASSATPAPILLLRSCSTACAVSSIGVMIRPGSRSSTRTATWQRSRTPTRLSISPARSRPRNAVRHRRHRAHALGDARTSVAGERPPAPGLTGRIHVIHNGIVENYRELRAELMSRGHEFLSETDTEVVPHLIEDAFHGDLASAVRSALNRMQGACALVVISADQPDRVVGARMNAPLVVGLGRGEVFVSSDITALIPYTKRIALLGEGEIVTATPDGITVQQLDGTAVEARIVTVDWEAEQAQKNGFPHFLLKEIHEQPEAVRNALRGRIDDLGMVVLPELGMGDEQLAGVHEVVLVACGSSMPGCSAMTGIVHTQ